MCNTNNKYLWISLLLAIHCGILTGICHASSVAKHRTDAQIDTFSEMVVNAPIQTIKAEFEPITKPKVVFARNDEVDVVRIYDDGIPEEVRQSAEKWGAVYNICPELIEALAYQESRYIPDVVSADGSCIGLCQINQGCHRSRMKRLGVTDLTDIDGNIAVACDYLAEIFAEHEDVAETLYIYNGNSAGLANYMKTGEIKSTYVNEILDRSECLEFIHGKKRIERTVNTIEQ